MPYKLSTFLMDINFFAKKNFKKKIVHHLWDAIVVMLEPN